VTFSFLCSSIVLCLGVILFSSAVVLFFVFVLVILGFRFAGVKNNFVVAVNFCRVIFGMLIALPITLFYYIILGLK
jgi:hypothetical protein